jgi:signal peptidase I
MNKIDVNKKQASQPSQSSQPVKKKRDILFTYILPLLEIIFIIFVLRTFILEAYQVPTGSMIDTILPGDFLLVEKVTFRINEPQKGEVIVFKYPLEQRVKYVKRCIATAGDTVETRDKILYVNGQVSPFQAAQLRILSLFPVIRMHRLTLRSLLLIG